MKKYLIIPALALAACTGNGDSKTDTTDYCFLLTEGAANQDTTTVHLIINAGKVNGEMKWIPKEKDSRKGTLTGTVSGEEIAAVWHFMQEGAKDSIDIAFRLSSGQLAQKPLMFNTASGRQETDTSAGYSLLYKHTNCD